MIFVNPEERSSMQWLDWWDSIGAVWFGFGCNERWRWGRRSSGGPASAAGVEILSGIRGTHGRWRSSGRYKSDISNDNINHGIWKLVSISLFGSNWYLVKSIGIRVCLRGFDPFWIVGRRVIVILGCGSWRKCCIVVGLGFWFGGNSGFWVWNLRFWLGINWFGTWFVNWVCIGYSLDWEMESVEVSLVELVVGLVMVHALVLGLELGVACKCVDSRAVAGILIIICSVFG